MPKYLIKPGDASPDVTASPSDKKLRIAEVFYDTIQGEGAHAGAPSIFVRLAGCPVACTWCDTTDVWSRHSTWPIPHLIEAFRKNGLIERLDSGHHLILTGGSPLHQQDALAEFAMAIVQECAGKPFIEIENECSIKVEPSNYPLFYWVDCWNNSPKLSDCGSSFKGRYNSEAFRQVIQKGSEVWFKFVISLDREKAEAEWREIEGTYMRDGVKRNQIILMPLGSSVAELTAEKRRFLAEFAIDKCVRYSERVQVNLYDESHGV